MSDGTTSRIQVSIGVPVFNGENYLEDAVRSILRQTFRHFEVIICDNASTDATPAICRRLCAEDPRIRYYRHESNLGAARNFNEAFVRARGTYFKWAAHDDLLEPTFLETCVEALERHPDAVLAFCRTVVLCQSTGTREPYDVAIPMEAPGVVQRLRRLLTGHQFYEFFGVIRRDVLARTGLMGAYFAADAVLLMRLALRGRFIEVPERLFVARSHDEQCMARYRARPYRFAAWYDSSQEGRISFPYWRIGGEYVRAVLGAPVTGGQKCLGLLLVASWWLVRVRYLMRDLWFAAAHLVPRRAAPRAGRRRPGREAA